MKPLTVGLLVLGVPAAILYATRRSASAAPAPTGTGNTTTPPATGSTTGGAEQELPPVDIAAPRPPTASDGVQAWPANTDPTTEQLTAMLAIAQRQLDALGYTLGSTDGAQTPTNDQAVIDFVNEHGAATIDAWESDVGLPHNDVGKIYFIDDTYRRFRGIQTIPGSTVVVSEQV
jgi:hypothetical protein